MRKRRRLATPGKSAARNSSCWARRQQTSWSSLPKTDKGLSLFLVDAKNVKIKPYVTLDEQRAGDVVLSGAKGELIGTEGGALPVIEEVMDFATALICAEAVGAMKFACDTTLEYLKTRKQFGVTIGTFQALQHRMVDMYVSYEQAKSMACLAASNFDTPVGGGKDRTSRWTARARFRRPRSRSRMPAATSARKRSSCMAAWA